MRRLLLSFVVCLFLCGCPKGGDLISPGPAPGDVPSAEMQELVKFVVPIEDNLLSQFYGDFADVIARDSEIIKSTDSIRTANMRAGQLMFQKTDMKGKYPGLADNVDAAIIGAIGKQNIALTPELRQRAVDVFKALSWAAK